MMVKKNYKYMHTIKGKPAYFVNDKRCTQICYAGQYVNSLCDSLKQIREEQKISNAWRKNKGYCSSLEKYGYKKVVI